MAAADEPFHTDFLEMPGEEAPLLAKPAKKKKGGQMSNDILYGIINAIVGAPTMISFAAIIFQVSSYSTCFATSSFNAALLAASCPLPFSIIHSFLKSYLCRHNNSGSKSVVLVSGRPVCSVSGTAGQAGFPCQCGAPDDLHHLLHTALCSWSGAPDLPVLHGAYQTSWWQFWLGHTHFPPSIHGISLVICGRCHMLALWYRSRT